MEFVSGPDRAGQRKPEHASNCDRGHGTSGGLPKINWSRAIRDVVTTG